MFESLFLDVFPAALIGLYMYILELLSLNNWFQNVREPVLPHGCSFQNFSHLFLFFYFL